MVGARWWNESFQAFHGRRGRGPAAAAGRCCPGWSAAASARRCWGCAFCERHDDDDDSAGISPRRHRPAAARGLERRAPRHALVSFSDLVRDVDGQADWLGRMRDAGRRCWPPIRTCARFAVPTLFQALAEPANQSLRADDAALCTRPSADAVFARGEALRGLQPAARRPPGPGADRAICPGPLSVALAAALAPRFCPVFTFDNWPHPLGVVPSHLTLGACLYYLPLFRRRAPMTRPQPAPPLFVLDANRLNPYRDQPDQFDNRYVAPVPSAGGPARGWASSASSTSAPTQRSADRARRPERRLRRLAAGGHRGAGGAAQRLLRGRPAAASPDAGGHRPTAPAAAHYYCGGHSYHHPLFWRSYGYGAGPAPTPPRRLRTPPPPARLSRRHRLPAQLPPDPVLQPHHRRRGRRRQAEAERLRPGLGAHERQRAADGDRQRSRRSGSFGRSRSSYSG